MPPASAAIAAIYPAADHTASLIGFTYIARRMGAEDRSLRWLLGRVRQLIVHHNFPGPATFRIVKEQMLHGADAVELRARWNRILVDQWFDGFLPPHVAEILDEHDIAQHADLLDARAAIVGPCRRRKAA